MIITEENRYLLIPYRKTAEECYVTFSEGGTPIADIKVRADEAHPEFYVHYDMSRFLSRDIEILAPYGKVQTSSAPQPEGGGIRPTFHFAPTVGWMNDPNGLVYYEGVYHMFFQHNPAGTTRGSEHWGHAISYDLLHWEQKEHALFPDCTGTVFSGSAIIDERNLLGMREGEHDPLVLFYTASGGERADVAKGVPFTQGIAISTDGGKRFVKYAHNPVIGAIAARTRDPGVVYDPESGLYVMVLYVGDGIFGFFRSENLHSWEHFSDFSFPEDRQCPDLIRLRDGKRDKWVLSGGTNVYAVIDIDAKGGSVRRLTEPKQFGYGELYAAQTFRHTEQALRMAWSRPSRKNIGDWDASPSHPSDRFTCFMSAPALLTLKDDTLHVAPAALPTLSTETLCGGTLALKPQPLALRLSYEDANACGSIRLFGNTLTFERGTLTFTNLLGIDMKMPFTGTLTVLADTLGYDLYASDLYYASYHAVSDYASSMLVCEGTLPSALELGYFRK